jgi:hypothetical protein
MTKQLHDGDSTGIEVGRDANDKVGFFGATPVTQQVVANSITTTATTTQIETTVLAIRSALISLGLFTGS